MATERQKRDIQKLMRSIKNAKDNGKSEKIIEKRTQKLYQYLHAEGLINNSDE